LRTLPIGLAVILTFCFVFAQTPSPLSPKEYALTIAVEGMDSTTGNLGILIFNGPNGWAENRQAALKDISTPAQSPTQKVEVKLPAGKYAIALIHDVNVNHKLDKNWIGVPKEQWGMSNNPHATIKAPPIEKAMFTLDGDKEVKIQLQR